MADRNVLGARIRPRRQPPFYESNSFQGWAALAAAAVLTVIGMYSRTVLAHWLLAVAWVAASGAIWRASSVVNQSTLLRLIAMAIGSVMVGGILGLIDVNVVHVPPKSIPETSAPTFEMESIRELDVFLAGKDEPALQDFFGVGSMLAANIQYETDRILHFQRTGNSEFPWGPYMKDGTTTYDTSIMGNRLRPQGGGFAYLSDPSVVYGIIVPKTYTDGKALLFKFETSVGLPSTIAVAVKSLNDALFENEQILIKVLNEALHADKNYYLHYNDTTSKYWVAIDAMYYKRFMPLRPRADAIRESARAFLGVR